MSQPYKRIVTIDFETRWSKADYTLSKLTTEEYIRDPRFKAFGACIKYFDEEGEASWISAANLQAAFNEIDWSTTAILAHNAQFDVSILEWVYDCHPCFIFDTLSMARALRGVEVGNSLMKLAEDFGLPPKGKAVNSTDGLTELTQEIEYELADYCMHDVFLCEEIFKRLIPGYPTSELRLIDMTLKMYTQPKLVLDQELLMQALLDERNQREELLARLNVDDAQLSSNPKFADILVTLGHIVPYKKSKTTGKQTFALAKNDALFQAMLNSKNEDLALLCEARLAVKSTTERTRAQRFLDISTRGTLPVPLSYYGAVTGRWTASKGSAINMQNLKRATETKRSLLREAIMAPDDYTLVVGDLSQIEPRVLAWLADYDSVLDIFRAGGDVYSTFGAQMFNLPGMSKKSHPIHRQSAKSALLGAGYGLGWASFAAQLLTGFLGAPPLRYDKAFAKQLGVTAEYVDKFLDWEDNRLKMAEIPHTCTEEELVIHCVAAKKIIDKYREAAHPVVTFWQMCDALMHTSIIGGTERTFKCLTFRKGEIELPNGMKLLYPNLRPQRTDGGELVKDKQGRLSYVYGDDQTKLYAGKITNNITQALARIVMTDGMLRVFKRYPVVGTVHDEQIVMVPEAEAHVAEDWVLAQMIREPKFMPGIPLNAELGTAKRYGEAK